MTIAQPMPRRASIVRFVGLVPLLFLALVSDARVVEYANDLEYAPPAPPAPPEPSERPSFEAPTERPVLAPHKHQFIYDYGTSPSPNRDGLKVASVSIAALPPDAPTAASGPPKYYMPRETFPECLHPLCFLHHVSNAADDEIKTRRVGDDLLHVVDGSTHCLVHMDRASIMASDNRVVFYVKDEGTPVAYCAVSRTPELEPILSYFSDRRRAQLPEKKEPAVDLFFTVALGLVLLLATIPYCKNR